VRATFRNSFKRDLKQIRSDRVLADIRQAIIDVEAAATWSDVPGIKKIRGATNAFRIRIDDYRIGLYIDDDVAEFVRALPRRDIYRRFP
jgi:mRNA interferase RelE/StbE